MCVHAATFKSIVGFININSEKHGNQNSTYIYKCVHAQNKRTTTMGRDQEY
uniref:Uncharacterized protein n=1 Tax=Arion vulgaris TaxID=1028688 RepID=A0A0B7B508_9EUPU